MRDVRNVSHAPPLLAPARTSCERARAASMDGSRPRARRRRRRSRDRPRTRGGGRRLPPRSGRWVERPRGAPLRRAERIRSRGVDWISRMKLDGARDPRPTRYRRIRIEREERRPSSVAQAASAGASPDEHARARRRRPMSGRARHRILRRVGAREPVRVDRHRLAGRRRARLLLRPDRHLGDLRARRGSVRAPHGSRESREEGEPGRPGERVEQGHPVAERKARAKRIRAPRRRAPASGEAILRRARALVRAMSGATAHHPWARVVQLTSSHEVLACSGASERREQTEATSGEATPVPGRWSSAARGAPGAPRARARTRRRRRGGPRSARAR